MIISVSVPAERLSSVDSGEAKFCLPRFEGCSPSGKSCDMGTGDTGHGLTSTGWATARSTVHVYYLDVASTVYSRI